MKPEFYVQIIERSFAFNDEIIKKRVMKEMGPYSERKAERIEDGVNINLNHDRYYTTIKEV